MNPESRALGGTTFRIVYCFRGTRPVNFLLMLLRMLHTVLGITPPKPEHERRYLLLWTVSLIVVILISIGTVLLLVPRIMH